MEANNGCGPTPSGQILCVDPPQCFAPARWVCATQGTVSCVCELPAPTLAPGKLCTASIVYGVNTPSTAYLVPMEPHCDAAGIEIAISVIIWKCMAGLISCGTP